MDYPNEIKDGRKGNDRIKILEDTDGDGKCDSVKIFADGLNIPTSFTFSRGGIIVAHAPEFIFFKDTNGDDKAPHLINNSSSKVSPAKPMILKQASQIFEAEDAGRKGPTVARNSRNYTGKGFVDFQADRGEHINWVIQANKADEYSLSFRYALADGSRPLQLKVNGKVITKAMPFTSTGSWLRWETIATTANLKAGINDIRLESTGASGPNVDNLTISTKP